MATGTLGSSARDYHTRQTHYLAKAVTVADVGVNGTVVVGIVPAGAVVKAISYAASVVFNGTTPTLKMGTTPTGAELVAAATFAAALGLTVSTLVATAAGPMAADTTIYATGVMGGSQTTGNAVIFVEYFAQP
jgi:hypothetical protein